MEALAERLAQRGHEVAVFCTSAAAGVKDQRGVQVHRLPNKNLYWAPGEDLEARTRAAWHLLDQYNVRSAGAAASAVRDFAPDVIHVHNISGFSHAIFPALRQSLPETPVVQTLHDFHHACIRKSLIDRWGRPCATRHLTCRLRSRLLAPSLEHVDRFVAPSRFLADYLVQAGILPADRTGVVPNGVEIPGGPSPMPPLDQDGPIRIGFVGQLAAHKGIQLLADALVDSRGAATVEAIGEGPLRSSLKGVPGLNLHGRLVGEAKWQVLRSCHLVAVPSTCAETFSLVALEGLSLGRPVLASRIGALPELVHDNQNGQLVEPTSNAWSKAIASLRGAPIAEWASDAREAKLPTLEEMTTAYERIYAEISHESPA